MEATLNQYYREAMKANGLGNSTSPMIKKIIKNVMDKMRDSQSIEQIEFYKKKWDDAEARILELEHLIPTSPVAMVTSSEK
tara:strand:+ start:271 stop:513 length:243 start_codon:yes stop_codon:yes gene_type:complete